MSPGKKLEEIRQEKGLTGVKTCDCFSLFLLIDRAGVWLLSNGLLCNQPIRIPCNYLSLTRAKVARTSKVRLVLVLLVIV